MPDKEDQIKILAVSKSSAIHDAINSALKGEKDFMRLEQENLIDGIDSTIAKLQPDIVLLDFNVTGEDTYELVDELATRFPSAAVVVILPESLMNVSDKIILSGARAFILDPFTPKNLLATLRRVVELLKRNFPAMSAQDIGIPMPIKPKNTYTIFSPKGGSGCTTVTLSLAIALRQLLKEPVLLIDGKHLFGDVSLMLNLRTANSITDLITHAGMLDQRLINQVVVDHVSGIKVLPSPLSISESQGIRPEDLYKVIIELQATFPFILVDGGNTLTENTVTYMDASDHVIIILNPNLASVRNTRQFIEVCNSLSYPKEKILFVLNNSGHKADIRKEEIEKILNREIICEIPSDENLTISSLNEGVPVLLKNSRHPISKAIQNLAATIKIMITEANNAYSMAEKKNHSEILSKTSRLG
jgi:pilus assembly protein CpaE